MKDTHTHENLNPKTRKAHKTISKIFKQSVSAGEEETGEGKVPENDPQKHTHLQFSADMQGGKLPDVLTRASKDWAYLTEETTTERTGGEGRRT